jgi:sulfur carrier protein
VNLLVNGESATHPDGTTVLALVRSMVESERGVAVAVDREVVPRSAWATTTLADGASVEVLVAAAGG